MTHPQRVDRALVSAGLVRSIEEAHALIADDRVTVNGAPVMNAARQVSARDHVAVVEVAKFVSRGGLKLEAALDALGVSVSGARVLDAGASTGGFVDCLLQRGAAHVVACDVGRGLLHPKVANDPRVEVCDEVNARDIGDMVRDGRLSGGFDVVVADLSFISLTTVAKSLMDAARAGGTLLLLVKPQFEATKEEVDRGSGVIADDAVRQRCIRTVRDSLERLGARYVADVECAVPGPAGNREHWLQVAAQ